MRTKFKITFYFTIFLSLFLIISPINAWDGATHRKIADEIYYNLPSDVQEHLKPYLSVMGEGSTYPDIMPSDQINHKINHRYPGSYIQTKIWLNRGRSAYENGNYKEAAWCFGIASHYISDNFVAYHCAWIEDKEKFCQVGNQLTPKKQKFLGMDIMYIDLQHMFKYGFERGKESAINWDKTENPDVVQQNLDQSFTASYIAIFYQIIPCRVSSHNMYTSQMNL